MAGKQRKFKAVVTKRVHKDGKTKVVKIMPKGDRKINDVARRMVNHANGKRSKR